MLKYKEYPPHASLREHVNCFWVMEREYTADFPAEEVTPDAFVELILNFGTPYRLHDSAVDREMPPAILVGLLRKPLVFRANGVVRLVATRFFAWGAIPFLAARESDAVRLRTDLGSDWSTLADRLRPVVEAGDYDAAVASVQDHLIEKLLAVTVDPATLRAAAQMLHLRKGQLRLTELAEHCGLSARRLQRAFRDTLGTSPKALARAIRFEEIRKRLMFDPDQSLTALAHEFGYADQSHFIHDFKELADRTPGEFADQMRDVRALFWDSDNVVFLQARSARRR
jgi:AraC-like DNA-binding protein